MRDIYIPPPSLIGKELSDQIAEHNQQVEHIWLTVGSRCKPFKSSSSTVSAAQSPGAQISVKF